MVVGDWLEVGFVVESVSVEDKVAAVLLCFSSGGGFTVREVRRCAGGFVSVGDKMAGRIVRFLSEVGLVWFDRECKRWRASDVVRGVGSFEDALALARSVVERYRDVFVRMRYL